jgi:hypothetical protein
MPSKSSSCQTGEGRVPDMTNQAIPMLSYEDVSGAVDWLTIRR